VIIRIINIGFYSFCRHILELFYWLFLYWNRSQPTWIVEIFIFRYYVAILVNCMTIYCILFLLFNSGSIVHYQIWLELSRLKLKKKNTCTLSVMSGYLIWMCCLLSVMSDIVICMFCLWIVMSSASQENRQHIQITVSNITGRQHMQMTHLDITERVHVFFFPFLFSISDWIILVIFVVV